MGLSPASRDNNKRRSSLILAYNLGRIISYSIAGILAGTLGMVFVDLSSQYNGYKALHFLAGIFLIVLGLHVAGFLPQLKRIENLGMGAWRVLQKTGKSFLPVDNFFRALAFGSIWGWLPCGMVYSVLLWTVSSADPILGGAYMLAFGLGTLPGMCAAGILAQQMTRLFNRPYIRQVFGVLIMVFGLASITLQPMSHAEPGSADHSHHHHH